MLIALVTSKLVGRAVLGHAQALRASEERLSRSQKTFAELVERSPFGTYVVDSQFRIAMMNAASQEGAFRNVRPVIGRDFAEAMRILWPEPVAAEIIGHFRHTLDTGEPYYSPRFVNPRHDVEIVEAYEWELHRMTLPDGQYGVICYYYDSTKLRQAEAAVRASRAKLATAFASMTEAIFIADADGRLTEFNDEFVRYHRFKDRDECSRTIEDCPKYLDAYFADGTPAPPEQWAMARALRGETASNVEYRLRRKETGETWWGSYNFAPIKGEDGGIVGAIVSAREITALKQAEEALAAAHRQTQSLIDNTTAMVYACDLEERFVLANAALAALLRTTPAQLLGKRRHEFMPQADADAHEAADRKVIAAGRAVEFEEHSDLHGRSITWLSTKFPLRDAQGRIYGVAGIVTDISERKRAEEALRESEERAKALVKYAPTGIYEIDLKGKRFITVNDAMCQTLGYTRDELLAIGPMAVLDEESRARFVDRVRGTLSGQPVDESVEYRVLRKDGSAIDAEAGNSDIVRNRVIWSDEAYRIFGLRPHELEATYEAFLDAVHPEDRASVDGAFSECPSAEGRGAFDFEYRIIRRDNGETTRRSSAPKSENTRDESGRIDTGRSGWSAISPSARRRRLCVKPWPSRTGSDWGRPSSRPPIRSSCSISTARSGTSTPPLKPLTGSPGTGQWDDPTSISSPASRRTPRFKRGHRSGDDLGTGRCPAPIPDGGTIDLEVTVSPAKEPSGTVIGGLATETDVTQKNALQQQIRQAQKMEALGTLAGGITHDFNNILGTIIINTELALLDMDPSDPARAPLPVVLQAANRGKELVKQIITFSRQRAWERKPFEIAPVVKEGMGLLRSTLPKNISVHEKIDPRSGIVLADPSHIHQILVNLCQNAALAMMDRGGDLEVGLGPVEVDAFMAVRNPDLKPGPYVRLTVSDTGCGMGSEILDRIFEPFFTTREQSKGSGLGLAVVHGIVKSYDGAIAVQSQPGKGSVFNIYLHRLDGAAAAAGVEPPVQAVGGRERILLVEDEETQRTSLARGLEHLGYKITAAADGRSALAKFRKDPRAFDLVVTDQIMPRMSGLELASELAKIRPDIPVILCTGFSEKVDDGTVGRHGIRELVMKPFTITEITRAIGKALKKDGAAE